MIQKYVFMKNSREDEMEADRIGFRTAVGTGYSKDHVGLFYDKLLQMEQKAKRQQTPVLGSLADAMSTHPPSVQRVQQMKQMAASQKRNPKAKVSSREFDAVRKLAGQYSERARQRAQRKG